jgi:hypothetical protein
MYIVELDYKGKDLPHLVLSPEEVEDILKDLKVIRKNVCGDNMFDGGLDRIAYLRTWVETVCAQKALTTEVGEETIRDTNFVLHPDHISSFLVILKVAERVIKKESPWNTQSAENGSLQIIDWFSTMIQSPKK